MYNTSFFSSNATDPSSHLGESTGDRIITGVCVGLMLLCCAGCAVRSAYLRYTQSKQNAIDNDKYHELEEGRERRLSRKR